MISSSVSFSLSSLNKCENSALGSSSSMAVNRGLGGGGGGDKCENSALGSNSSMAVNRGLGGGNNGSACCYIHRFTH